MVEGTSLSSLTKKKHPFERANCITNIFFCWLLPYFKKGLKKELTENDLYGVLQSHESSRLGDKLEKAWDYQVAHKNKPSLILALLHVFRFELVLYAFYYLFQEFVAKLSQPLLISKFLKFYEPNQTDMTKTDAYIYAALIVFFALINVLCIHGYYLRVMHLGLKVRIAVCSLIYRKALKLSKTALADTTVGQMVNLLSNDVGRFELITVSIHNLWVAPIETAIIMYLLYVYVGPTGLTGVCFLLLFVPFQMYMGKKISQYRSKTASRTDERVRLMSEIITGIQVIKMFTWEEPFTKLVKIARKKEMRQIRATSTLRALMISFISVLHRSAVYLCIITYVLTGNVVNATYVYTMAGFYGILRQVVTMFFPRAITQLAETNISIQRVENFLIIKERDDSEPAISTSTKKNISENELNSNILENFETHNTVIRLENISVKWLDTVPEFTLQNVTFVANTSQLTTIVGKVGGGKSTLFHVILKELTPIKGTVEVAGSISYSDQQPWLFGGNIKENIIFGQQYDERRYQEVVRVCALEKDFNQLPYGDRTLVGDRGTTLSGGQKVRINLARAVYKNADIYLLDDPLSAVDMHVGKEIFEKCICGFLKNKCVVLITNQLQYLTNVDNIYLFQYGKIEAVGSYNKLTETESEFKSLLVENQDVEEKIDVNTNFVEVDKENNKNSQTVKAPVQEKEQRGSGTVSKRVYKSYMQAGGSWPKIIVLLFGFLLAQTFAALADYFVTLWVNLEQWRSQNVITEDFQKSNNFNDTFKNDTVSTSNKDLIQYSEESVQYFLNLLLTEHNALMVYTFLIITSVVLAFTRSISFFRCCMTASSKLHNMMFNKIIEAPMKFFFTNASGRILNRFSKDIGTVDEILPLTIADTLQIALIVLSIAIMIGCINPWILIPTLIIVIIFYCVREVFLATSRDLKRLEALSRSPIYTHLRTCIDGLTTIRAFGAQNVVRREFDNYQNRNTSASFMFLAANRTFGFWLDFQCVIYTALIIISILFIKSELLGGNVGLALTEAVGLTGMFQFGIRQWSEMENQMTAVERLQEYIDTTSEGQDSDSKPPPKLWAKKGTIVFINVCLKYFEEQPFVLKNITFEIKSMEKIGIVGRTGSGKSSLIAAIFRLTDIEGQILIDGINIKDIALNTLRSNMSIIPQEPILFSGNIRRNLDPFDQFSDDVLWSALDEVELKYVVDELPGGLDHKVMEDGSNFSVGQRQLICLARAILHDNKIIILDEATANVDSYTDGLIQSTIRKKFKECTVLTIAHRLNSIMDADKVLVMDGGKVIEFDHPQKLLQNESGAFYELVKQTGRAMADRLMAIAAENYDK